MAVEANLDVGTTRRTHPEPPAQVGKGSVIITGHAFIQNLRRGHYHLTAALPTKLRVAAAFDEISHAI